MFWGGWLQDSSQPLTVGLVHDFMSWGCRTFLIRPVQLLAATLRHPLIGCSIWVVAIGLPSLYVISPKAYTNLIVSVRDAALSLFSGELTTGKASSKVVRVGRVITADGPKKSEMISSPNDLAKSGKVRVITANRPKIVDAANSCNEKRLQELLAQGIPANTRDASGDTALSYAVKSNCRKGIIMLLEQGADPGIKGKSGYSSYDWARIYKRRDLMLLLERGRRARKE